MSNSKLLEKKTALVTGSNRGIGKSILELFAREGASIIACARKESDDFVSLIKSLSSDCNVSIRPLYFDLSDEDSIKNAMKVLYNEKIKIDILVNNAGIATGGFLQITSMAKLKEVFQINFFSHVQITQIVIKLMIRQKHGSIINLGSVAGLDAMPGYASYGSSKAALMHFTKIISTEVASSNIRINAIAPGLTDTRMATQMESRAYNEMISNSSMNRLGKPEEIAELALFLASEKSSFINGQIIRIDGGTVI